MVSILTEEGVLFPALDFCISPQRIASEVVSPQSAHFSRQQIICFSRVVAVDDCPAEVTPPGTDCQEPFYKLIFKHSEDWREAFSCFSPTPPSLQLHQLLLTDAAKKKKKKVRKPDFLWQDIFTRGSIKRRQTYPACAEC